MADQLYQIPNPVTSFGVTCAIGQYVMDGDDEGKDPDLIAIGGTVEITPNLKTPLRINLDPVRIASHDTMTFQIDPSSGELIHPDGTVGIELINSNDELLTPKGWSYTATIRPAKGKSWSTTFVGPPEGASSIDLALVAPVNPNPGTVDPPLDPSLYLTKDEAKTSYAKIVHTHTADQVSFQNGSETTDVQSELLAQLSSIGSLNTQISGLDLRVTDLEENGGGGGGETPDTGPRDMSAVWVGDPNDVTWYIARIQRIGSLVQLTYVCKFNNAIVTPSYTIPSGFTAPPGHTLSMIAQYLASTAQMDLKVSLLQTRNQLTMGGSDLEGPTYGTALWITTDPWPETLPGAEVPL